MTTSTLRQLSRNREPASRVERHFSLSVLLLSPPVTRHAPQRLRRLPSVSFLETKGKSAKK